MNDAPPDDFPPDDSPPTVAESYAFRTADTIVDREIIAACVNDHSGATKTRCAGLPKEIFADKEARNVWSVISRGVNGYSTRELAEKSFMPERSLLKILNLPHAAENFTTNLANIRARFRKSQLAAVQTEAGAPEADTAQLRARLDDIDRATGTKTEQLEGQLTARAYDPALILEKPTAIFSLKGTTICTQGNLTTLLSQAKAGKSAIVGAMISAAHDRPTNNNDTLSISGPNYAGHAFLHFDTEQSPYDWQQVIRSSMRRVNREQPEPWFLSYTLTGLDAVTSRALVAHAIQRAHQRFGGIFAVIIDGTADLVVDPNDPDECFPLVTKLHGLAIEFKTTIINIVHMNPGASASDGAKARGHLGSQLERKSESNLMLEKNAEGVTKIWGTKQRGKMIAKADAPSFSWSDADGRHTTCESAPLGDPGAKGGRPAKYEFGQFRDIFPRDPKDAKTGATLLKMAQAADGNLSKTSFHRLITTASEQGLLVRVVDGVSVKFHMALV